MNHLDLAQQSLSGEFHPRVPNGARLIEAWESNGELIVCGSPREDDEEHDCDAMGCTSICHVVLRVSIPAGVHLDGASRPHQNTDNLLHGEDRDAARAHIRNSRVQGADS
jgi:hypothetical protein